MGVEIERKFLVDPAIIPDLPPGKLMKQGYISTAGFTSVRARIKGDEGFFTVKGPSSEDGLSRQEFEYPIPPGDAIQIIECVCDGGTIEKTRHEWPIGNLVWEIDIFHGANEGLVMAEVELPDANMEVEIPDWAIEEVTGDIRYYNMRLATDPMPKRKD